MPHLVIVSICKLSYCEYSKVIYQEQKQMKLDEINAIIQRKGAINLKWEKVQVNWKQMDLKGIKILDVFKWM